MREFVFDGTSGEKLSRYLGRVYPELGKGYFRELLKKRDIKINGARISEDAPLSFGDKIAVYAAEQRLTPIKTQAAFETPDIAVYVKPRGITNEEFAARVASARVGAEVCHRLDTNTEGLLIFALNPEAYQIIKEAFKNGGINKRYIARVVGNLDRPATLHAYLTKDDVKGLVKITDEPTADAVRIVTGVLPISYDPKSGTSMVEVDLVTGKTHQIRAHLAHIGHPIVGDPKYGDFIFNRKTGKEKQLLSAYKLSFELPQGSRLSYLNTRKVEIRPDFD